VPLADGQLLQYSLAVSKAPWRAVQRVAVGER